LSNDIGDIQKKSVVLSNTLTSYRMKKLLFTISALCSALALHSQPIQKSDVPEVIFKFSPQHLIRGGLWLTGEFLNKEHSAGNQISIEAMYRRPTTGSNNTGILEASGITIDYAFKYYINKLRVEKSLGSNRVGGYYVGMFAQFGNYKEKVRYEKPNFPGWPADLVTNNISTQAIYPGFIFGKQLSLGEGFYVDLSVGAGIRIATTKLETPEPDYDFNDSPPPYFIYHNGLLPRIGLGLGFGF